jgi:hypothetical protein
MNIDSSSGAFSGPAPFVAELARYTQHAVQEQRDRTGRANANPVAAGDDDPAPLRADAPEGRSHDDDGARPPVAGSDPSRAAEREPDRGHAVDLTV